MNHHPSKAQYDEIPLPEQLEEAVSTGLRRGRRKQAAGRTLSGLAAMLALVFLLANVPALYVGAAEAPVLGPLVRIMRVGSGGRSEGLVSAAVYTVENTVQLRFSDQTGGAAAVPVFSAARREHPRRVILRLHDVGELKLETLIEALQKQAAVTEAYPAAVTEPHGAGVVFHLVDGYDCSVGEYGDSAVLGIDFFPGEPAREETVWSLCSPAMRYGPELAELTERLLWEGATQLRTETGEYRVVLGEYATRAQAEKAQQGIRETTGVALELFGGQTQEAPAK